MFKKILTHKGFLIPLQQSAYLLNRFMSSWKGCRYLVIGWAALIISLNYLIGTNPSIVDLVTWGTLYLGIKWVYHRIFYRASNAMVVSRVGTLYLSQSVLETAEFKNLNTSRSEDRKEFLALFLRNIEEALLGEVSTWKKPVVTSTHPKLVEAILSSEAINSKYQIVIKETKTPRYFRYTYETLSLMTQSAMIEFVTKRPERFIQHIFEKRPKITLIFKPKEFN